MTTMPCDVLLVAIQPDGSWLGGGLGPDEAVGAAAVAQLVIDGHASVSGTRVTIGPRGDLPGALEAQLRGDGELSAAVDALGPAVKEQCLAELARAGVLRVDRKKLLGLVPYSRITVLDTAPRDAVLARIDAVLDDAVLHDAVLDERSAPSADGDLTTAMLIAILQAAGLLPLLRSVPEGRLEEATSILETAPGTETVLDDVHRSLQQLRTAVFTSVILPYIARAGG